MNKSMQLISKIERCLENLITYTGDLTGYPIELTNDERLDLEDIQEQLTDFFSMILSNEQGKERDY